MKALPTISALVVLAAMPLNAMPASRLLLTPSGPPEASGFTNTQIGYSDLTNRPASPVISNNGDFAITNSAISSGANSGGGFGGSAGPFNSPQLGPPILGPSALSSSDAGGFGGASGAQPNGPLPVPEPSSSWFLLALALIPILKVRGSRKTRAS